MANVLVTAEAFGFGPASKLNAVSAELARRGVDCHFVGEASSLTFARANAAAFSSIVEVDSMRDLASVEPSAFAAAVSVMDPFLVLWASVHNIPCVYVDSLYWFWQWAPEDGPDLRKKAEHLRCAGSAADALDALDATPMHDSQYVAHHLSTVSCVQRAPTADARTGAMGGLHSVQVVDAVVDLSYRAPSSPTGWLATTSGLVNPLLPVESAVEWVRVVAQLLRDAAARSDIDSPIVLAGNPEVLERAPEIHGDVIQPMPMDHPSILSRMNQAIACLAPPGLTTMFECFAYGVPMVLLPEQHYAHLSNFREVVACGPAASFPHALVNTDDTGPRRNNHMAETATVSEQLRHHFSERDDVWERMVSRLSDGMRRARDEREDLRAAQDAAFRRFVGGYEGARQVADTVESLLP